MKLATSQQMKAIDRAAIETYHIPGCLLMEHAAQGFVEELANDFQGNISNRRILIVCGKGNNGGDGFAIARLLTLAGADVLCAVLCRESEITGDARLFYNAQAAQGGAFLYRYAPGSIQTGVLPEEAASLRTTARYLPFSAVFKAAGRPESNDGKAEPAASPIPFDEGFRYALAASELVVDAIFGTGFHGEMEDGVKAVIERINLSKKPVYSVDIPSGLEASSQAFSPDAVQALKTITFSLPKIANICYPAARTGGEVVVKDIGIPQAAVNAQNIQLETLEPEQVSSFLPQFGPEANKTDFGRLEIAAGSPGLTGAATLCAQAALTMGAGLVTVCAPSCVNDILEVKLTECMTHPLPHENGTLTADGFAVFAPRLQKADAVLFGPGAGRSEGVTAFLAQLVSSCYVPLVIDADGLYAIAQNPDILRHKKGSIILTPHAGEMARLIQKTPDYVNKNTIAVAKEYSLTYDVVVALKGPRTVIASPDGTVYVNIAGNNGLATGGTGDVLAGCIAALLAQGAPPQEAAAAGVYLHGRAAEFAANDIGTRPLTAGKLLSYLKDSINELLGGKNHA